MRKAGRALVIGIDDYADSPLTGCVNDARAVGRLLETHANGDLNFSVIALGLHGTDVRSHYSALQRRCRHGRPILRWPRAHQLGDQRRLPGQPRCGKGRLGNANEAHPQVKSSVIILDSCHSGYAGEVPQLGSRGQVSVIGTGVTILTACHREGEADEDGQHGLFTNLLLEGLTGSAADVRGYQS